MQAIKLETNNGFNSGDNWANMNLPDLKTIALRLKWARNNKGLTQMELAKLASVSRDVIQSTEVGKSERPRQIQSIADALEVPAAWLLFGNDVESLTKEGIAIAQKWESLPDNVKTAIQTIIESSE